jgi:hypothetical protein
LAAARGGYWKWRGLQDTVGIAENDVYTEVVAENTDHVIAYYQDKAKEQYTEWLDGAQAIGQAPTQAERVAKMKDLLHLSDGGSIGIEVGMDGAWQRRAIGFGKMNSMSGMNFCVDLNTKKILNLVVYSKQCTYCERWKKKHKDDIPMPPVPEHRCSQNFDPDDSSKSMEADASCLHKEDIELKPNSQVYIRTLCTDDDSSVRANTKYSLTEYYNQHHGAGNWTKEGVGWPSKQYTHPRTGKVSTVYSKDYGKLNLLCHPIAEYITDVNHRVRVIAKGVFSLKSSAKTPPPGRIAKEECYKLKGLASLYLKDKDNRDLPFQEFCRRAPCMYLHHFNDHSCCSVKWCKVLQSTRTDGVEATVLTEAYKSRFRDKQEDWITLKAVEDIYAPYMTEHALRQCYHGKDTNKNESLNKKCAATAPKDRYFSGTMNLDDRFRMVVCEDSVGYVESIERVFSKLGVCLELVCPVLLEWARRVDADHGWRKVYINKPEVKKRRTEAITALIKAWTNAEKKAEASGRLYASGVAVVQEVDQVVDSENVARNDDQIQFGNL